MEKTKKELESAADFFVGRLHKYTTVCLLHGRGKWLPLINVYLSMLIIAKCLIVASTSVFPFRWNGISSKPIFFKAFLRLWHKLESRKDFYVTE